MNTSPKDPTIRKLTKSDTDDIVVLSLRAWAKVFDSIASVLGPDLYHRMYPDWQPYQEKSVRDALAQNETWIVEISNTVAGFMNLIIDEDNSTGEIYMIAVDPAFQKKGLGIMLSEFALDKMKERGISLAIVSTGGDPGHLAARRTYEKIGFTPFPLVTYHKLL